MCVFLEYEWAWVCNIREVKIGHLMYYCIFSRTKNLANLIAVRRWAFAIPLISWGSNWIAKFWTLNIIILVFLINVQPLLSKAQTNQESNICWEAPKSVFFCLNCCIWPVVIFLPQIRNEELRFIEIGISRRCFRSTSLGKCTHIFLKMYAYFPI